MYKRIEVIWDWKAGSVIFLLLGCTTKERLYILWELIRLDRISDRMKWLLGQNTSYKGVFRNHEFVIIEWRRALQDRLLHVKSNCHCVTIVSQQGSSWLLLQNRLNSSSSSFIAVFCNVGSRESVKMQYLFMWVCWRAGEGAFTRRQ